MERNFNPAETRIQKLRRLLNERNHLDIVKEIFELATLHNPDQNIINTLYNPAGDILEFYDNNGLAAYHSNEREYKEREEFFRNAITQGLMRAAELNPDNIRLAIPNKQLRDLLKKLELEDYTEFLMHVLKKLEKGKSCNDNELEDTVKYLRKLKELSGEKLSTINSGLLTLIKKIGGGEADFLYEEIKNSAQCCVEKLNKHLKVIFERNKASYLGQKNTGVNSQQIQPQVTMYEPNIANPYTLFNLQPTTINNNYFQNNTNIQSLEQKEDKSDNSNKPPQAKK